MRNTFNDLMPLAEASKKLAQATGLPTPKSTWHKWAQTGKIPCVKLGTRYFIPAKWVASSIAQIKQDSHETQQHQIISRNRHNRQTARPAVVAPSNSDGTTTARRATPDDTDPATS